MIARSQGLHQIAKQASFLEDIGNFSGADRLRVLLEKHNCCLLCGSEQIFDLVYYHRTGLWGCPTCNSGQLEGSIAIDSNLHHQQVAGVN